MKLNYYTPIPTRPKKSWYEQPTVLKCRVVLLAIAVLLFAFVIVDWEIRG